jgi:mannose-1-phosphate guanylyltransferase
MRAILLAAGFGTRLRPLTDTIPKCLVAIKGAPLLEIWLDSLKQSGLGPFLVNTHYLSSQVNDFLSKSKYSKEITIAYEKTLLGTAGTLLNNISFFNNEDGMLIHADNYCLADIVGFQKAHHNRPEECLMTMMTFRTDNPSSCGIAEIDDRGVLISFHEKRENPPGNLANGAVYILSTKFIEIVSSDFRSAREFTVDILPNFLGRVFTYETSSTMIDIGTHENYVKANL